MKVTETPYAARKHLARPVLCQATPGRDSEALGPGLCRILQTDVREFHFLGTWVDIVGYSVVENEDRFEERMTNAWSRFPTGRL